MSKCNDESHFFSFLERQILASQYWRQPPKSKVGQFQFLVCQLHYAVLILIWIPKCQFSEQDFARLSRIFFWFFCQFFQVPQSTFQFSFLTFFLFENNFFIMSQHVCITTLIQSDQLAVHHFWFSFDCILCRSLWTFTSRWVAVF